MKRILGLALCLALVTSPVGAEMISGRYVSGLPAPQSSGADIPFAVDQYGRSLVVSQPSSGSGAFSGAAVGTSAASILSASVASQFLTIINLSQSATVCLKFGGTATISGTQCAAGEIPLLPLNHVTWDGNFVPTDAVSAIASAASTPVTVGVK